MLPIAEKLKQQGELAYKEEERLRTHPEETDEGAVADVCKNYILHMLICIDICDHFCAIISAARYTGPRYLRLLPTSYKVYRFTQVSGLANEFSKCKIKTKELLTVFRAKWLKQPSRDTDGVYENVAVIFKNWSNSQVIKMQINMCPINV